MKLGQSYLIVSNLSIGTTNFVANEVVTVLKVTNHSVTVQRQSDQSEETVSKQALRFLVEEI